MRIPKVIDKDNHQYIFVKEYPNFILYKDMLTGVKECFKISDLIEIKGVRVSRAKWERQGGNIW